MKIRGTRDARFGGVHPEPIEPHIEALRQAVLAGKYDAGFAADGDGDPHWRHRSRRAASSTPTKSSCLMVWQPHRHSKSSRRYRQNFSVTKLIDKLAAKYGRKLHEVPVGFKYICELMLEQNILIGGEESGGIGTSCICPNAMRQSPRFCLPN